MRLAQYRELLSEMVGLNTVSPLSGARLAKVAGWLHRRGFRTIGRNLFARGSSRMPLWIYSHIDTKPVGCRADWHTHPLHLTVQGGRWHGLGISDAKFQLLNVLLSPWSERAYVLVDAAEECGDSDVGRLLSARDVDTFVVVDGFLEQSRIYNGAMGQLDGTITLRTGGLPRHPARSSSSQILVQLEKLIRDVETSGLRFNVTGASAPMTERSLTLEQLTLRFDLRFNSRQHASARSFVKRWAAETRQSIPPLEGRPALSRGMNMSASAAPFSSNLGRIHRAPRRVLVVPGALADNNNHRPNEFIWPQQILSHQRTINRLLGVLCNESPT